jgi:hypothetical protein
MLHFNGLTIAAIAIVGWIIVTVTRIVSRNRVREMMIRERIAMIEKGLVPPPESDPAGFERVMGRYDRDPWERGYRPRHHLRAGLILMGVGFGSMAVVGATSSMRNGLGAGGFLIALGLAFVLISVFEAPSERPNQAPPRTPVSPPPGAQRPE